MSPSLVVGLAAVLLLLAGNAFFVAAEFALIASRHLEKTESDEEPERTGGAVERARRDLDRTVSGTQLGLTLSALALGWVGVTALAPLLRRGISRIGVPWPSGVEFAVCVLIALAVVALLLVLFGELAPRAAAVSGPDTMARLVAPPLNGFNFLMAPVLWLLNRIADPIFSRTGLHIPGAHGRVHSPEEIEILLRQSRAEGIVEEDEEEMIHGVFELTHTVAREVMTPRPDIIAFPETASLDEVLERAAESGFSRFPVYRESIDDVTGVVLIKDLLRWMRRSGDEAFSLPAVMREPFFVPDTKPVDDLLAEFRGQKLHLAVVVDEFGGTDGVVTLEDLVEEIVGDIFDEHDVAQEEIEVLPDGRICIEGGASLEDVIDRLDLGLVGEASEYDTVAGYVIGTLGRIPEIGEKVQLGLAELEVIETQEQRVTRLELQVLEPRTVKPVSEIEPPEEAS
jgi:CBS domain containing-hemolysin-like protein